MSRKKYTVPGFSLEELICELLYRGVLKIGDIPRMLKTELGRAFARPPGPNPYLIHYQDYQLLRRYGLEYRRFQMNKAERGLWNDGRMIDYPGIDDKIVREIAQSTALVFPCDQLEVCGKDSWILKAVPFEKKFILAPSQPFCDQPVVAFTLSTGVLVAKDIIACSGHYVRRHGFLSLCIVFGYHMTSPGRISTRFDKRCVFRAKDLIHWVFDRERGSDWALIRLNRAVPDRRPVKMSSRDVYPMQKVSLMGYPVGLPLKYVPDGVVTDVHPAFFKAQVSAFEGNSGSPVFDSRGELVGILVRSDPRDFSNKLDGKVFQWYPCNFNSSGAVVVKSCEFSKYLHKSTYRLTR